MRSSGERNNMGIKQKNNCRIPVSRVQTVTGRESHRLGKTHPDSSFRIEPYFGNRAGRDSLVCQKIVYNK